MPDWLQAISQLLGAQPAAAQQQVTPTPAGRLGMVPQTTSAAPTPQATLGSIFEAPATQGLLNAYLGYLAAPRGENRWQRLGQAGLEGLHGFSQAEQFQAGAPQRAAALAGTQAKIQEALAAAQLKQAQATALGGKPEQILAENKRLHDMAYMRANDPTLSPEQQAASKAYADLVAGDSLNKHDIKEYESVLENPLKLAHLKAQIAETKAHTTEAGAHTTEALAQAGRASAEASKVPGERAHTAAETALTNERRSQLKGTALTPKDLLAIDKAATVQARLEMGTPPKVEAPGRFESVTGTVGREAAASRDFQQRFDAKKQAIKASMIAEREASHGSAMAAAAPADSAPTHYGPDGKTPYRYKGTGDYGDPANWEPVP